jgi:hypothetical protein
MKPKGKQARPGQPSPDGRRPALATLFVLVRGMTFDKVLEALKEAGGTIEVSVRTPDSSRATPVARNPIRWA